MPCRAVQARAGTPAFAMAPPLAHASSAAGQQPVAGPARPRPAAWRGIRPAHARGRQARAVVECGRVLDVAARHAGAMREAADQLAFLHGELEALRAPAWDVPTAADVLLTGAALCRVSKGTYRVYTWYM